MSSRFRLNLKEDTDSRVLKDSFPWSSRNLLFYNKTSTDQISLKKWNGIQHARLL